MDIDLDRFKATLSHFATGVTIVTTCLNTYQTGMTVNAFCSVSLVPPLVLVCIKRSSSLHDLLVQSSIFAVNILAERQKELSNCFARCSECRRIKFCDAKFHIEETGAPVLDDALGFVDCRVKDIFPGGDHSIFVGLVVALGSYDDDPLLYYHGQYSLHE